jgi:Coenzyme PQQ synthesis protein D (PqqD)
MPFLHTLISPERPVLTLHVGKNVLIQEVDGEAVLLDINQGTYYGLNEVGTMAWKYLIDTGNLEEAIQGILQEYEVDEATLRADLEAFVKDLIKNGLAEEIEP